MPHLCVFDGVVIAVLDVLFQDRFHNVLEARRAEPLVNPLEQERCVHYPIVAHLQQQAGGGGYFEVMRDFHVQIHWYGADRRRKVEKTAWTTLLS